MIKIKKGERKYVKDEIRTLETLQVHRNILTLHCALVRIIATYMTIFIILLQETTTAAYLVTEYYRNGSLETQKLKLHVQWRYDPKAAETTTRQYLKDLVSGLEKLDAHNIVHRDLKPSNLLIGDDGRLVIADFGVATELKRGERLDESVVGELLSIFGTTSDETSREYWVGTLFYKAPELLFRQPYTASVDLWSIGIILYQLVTAKYPFINLHSEFGVRVSTVQRHLATEMQKFFAIRSNVVETSTLPPDLEQLIAKLLLPQDQRITLSDVTAICNA